MNPKAIKIVLSITTAAFLSACGGGSSDSNEPSGGQNNAQTLSGVVSDPHIQNSLVQICLASDLQNCLDYNDKTDESGEFSIENIPSSINLSEYTLRAFGGFDTQTEEAFDDVNLTIPLKENSSFESIVVSPLTSLMQTNGWTKSETAQKLGMSEKDLLSDPTVDMSLQRKSLLLTKIAKKRAGSFSFDADANLSNISEVIENTFSSDEKTQKELLTYENILEDSNSANEVVSRFNGLKTVFSSNLYRETNSTDNQIFTNAKNWTLAALAHLRDNNITQMNVAQIQVVFANSNFGDINISADTNLTIDTEGINLVDILPLNALYDINIPLNSPLSFDSDARRNYYYSSTASTFHKAEQLIRGMNDISITDKIYVDLAKGYLENNEIERALKYAQNKIFLKENKADVLRFVGESLITTDVEKAENLFDEAFELYKEITDAKGAGNMKNVDIFDYRHLLKDYEALGNSTKAETVTSYITSKTEEFTNTTQYGSYLVGMNQAAQALLEKGDTSNAIKILDDAWALAQDIPANNADTKAPSGQHYKSRVFFALALAESYQLAGDEEKAIEIADAMQALRLNDGNSENGSFGDSGDTGAQTNAYVASSAGIGNNLVSIYVMSRELEKAQAVIPTATTSSFRQRGYAVLALGSAMTESNLEGAFTIIDNNITSYRDQVKTLTYNGINKGGKFIAQHFIEENNNAKAKEAIDKAIEILDSAVASNVETSDVSKDMHYVRFGYAKLANLYAMIGEESLATTYFNKAIAIATGTDANSSINIGTPTEQLDSLFEIIDNLDEVDRADEVVTQANKALEIINTLTTLKSKLNEYSEFLFYHASNNESYTLKRTYDFQEDVADNMKDLIVQNSGLIGESSNDANYKKAVDYLVEMSHTYTKLGKLAKTQEVLESAQEYALLIAKESDKVSKLQKVVEAYAANSDIDAAASVAKLIQYGADKRDAIASIANAIYLHDAFPQCSVASIDFDGDGKPDFFSQGATDAEINSCELVLDEDIDNDGIDENSDLRPYVVD